MNKIGLVHIEHEKNGAKFALSFPIGTPIGTIYDATYEILKEIADEGMRAVDNVKRVEDPIQEVKE